MTLNDFSTAARLLDGNKLTAFLQGGLSVTGTWAYLPSPPGAGSSTAIVMADHDGTRHVVPIDAITSLREVKVWSKPKPSLAEAARKLTPPIPYFEVG